MKRILFACDLDNTLLYSYKHKNEGDVCVEWLDGKEQGYFTSLAIKLLREVCHRTLFVPVTTRSIEQYQRIQWPDGCMPQYAVTTNGAILLHDGDLDPFWGEAVRSAVRAAHAELISLQHGHAGDPIYRRCRMVDDTYLFLMPAEDDEVDTCIHSLQEETVLPIARSGRKIYILPYGLDKGRALEFLRLRFTTDTTLAAGDSTMDIPMLCGASQAWTVSSLSPLPAHIHICPENSRASFFAEWLLNDILNRI